MSLWQSYLLALIQGITEFLPISSSGHLNLFQFIFGFKPSLALDVFLNTATLVSVIFFFRKKITFFFSHLPQIFIASLPAALVGFFLKDQFEIIFTQAYFLPFFFFINSLILLSTTRAVGQQQKITLTQALLIGLAQAVAILPGISRAGTTIATALALGLSAQTAFNFSFSLFIPVSLGALLLSLKDGDFHSFFNPQYFFVFLVTFLVGLFALNLLQKILLRRKLWYFAIYTFCLGLGTLIFYTYF